MIDVKKYLNGIPKNKIGDYLFQISKILTCEISIDLVLRHYGVHVYEGLEIQIPCILPTHGGRDNHNSARYYKDSDYGFPMVHCFKCDKTLNSFWIYYTIEKDKGFSSIDIIYNFIKDFEVDFTEGMYFKETLKSENYETEISLKQKIEYFKILKKSDSLKFKEEILKQINKN